MQESFYTIGPNRLVQECKNHTCARVGPVLHKSEQSYRAALDYPINMKDVLFACMKSNDKGMDELPRLVVINRVFNVHDFSDNDKYNPIDSPCW